MTDPAGSSLQAPPTRVHGAPTWPKPMSARPTSQAAGGTADRSTPDGRRSRYQ